MKVIVAGGSGFIGRHLVRSLAADGHEVRIVTRRPDPRDSSSLGWNCVPEEVDGADAVVNLAGESVGGLRWTRRKHAAILSSRVETTTALVEAIRASVRKPRVFVSASGIDFAGDSGDAVVAEDAAPGDTFLGHVCKEHEAAAARSPVRWVAVRTPLTIGRDATAVHLIALPFRLYAGGPLGSGRQWFPWIHVDDLVGIYRRAIGDESLHGPVHAVAPQQLRQRDAAGDFGRVLRRPSRLATPAVVLRALMGRQSDLLLHGQRAVSTKLDGFEFRYRTLRAALEDALA
jgi:uncharacterized protein (TIGR01777 family)